jgi:uncharacterized membrane protein HdeD (DUF308 family)
VSPGALLEVPMTADVSSPYTGAAPAKHTGFRVAVGVLGVAAVVLGIVLLFNPTAAARTLALLLGLSLVLGGLLEIASGWATGSRAAAIILGGILVIGGVLAIAWPGVTLKALVLITALSLILHGIGRVGLAIVARREIPGWGWLVLAGAINVLVGVLALLWPHVTVRVLAFILGLQVLLFGVLLVAAAFIGPRAREGV